MKKFRQKFSVVVVAGLMFFGLGVQANAQNSLTGTYWIDASQSENISEIASEAVSKSNVQNRDESIRDLQEKLESPENLAIEIRGNQVIIASSISPQLTLSADGSEQTQTLSDGSTIRLRATLRGQELTVSRLDNNNDYTVKFVSIDNGDTLKVSRRVTTDYLNETVFAESLYNKTDSAAQLDIFNQGNNNSTNTNYPTNYPPSNTGNNPPPPIRTTGKNPPTATVNPNGQYVVPNGEIITASLNNLISTKISQNNDRFRATVTGPNQFRGAIIEGYITGIDRSGRNPVGKTKLTLNFERIRLTNGETYDFAGFLQGVTDAKGKQVKVDEEGTITKGQTRETLKRAGIGAGAGAILGAIIGGGKGAIIGATIGAGGGAGSVAVENKGDVELESGTSLTVQASSPITK
jgi:hypothetical protein